MSDITALIVGVLSQTPISRTTAKGTTMATGSLAVQASADGKPTYLGLVAFGDLAETLLQCTKGDAVAVRGRLELNRWVTSEGEQKERWQVIADALLPGPGKPQATKTAPRPAKSHTQAAHRLQGQPEPPPFDDALF